MDLEDSYINVKGVPKDNNANILYLEALFFMGKEDMDIQ